MTRLMIVIASVRPGRVGRVVGDWALNAAVSSGRVEIDFADLVEVGLPFMDEPNHPRLRQYTHEHTRRWSARVDAADAYLFVTPEYNHSFAPALKNALDFVFHEWTHKPVAFVSYGGVSAGSRGVAALDPVLAVLGMLRTGSNVEIPFVARQVTEGAFAATEFQEAALASTLAELEKLGQRMSRLRLESA